MKTLWPDTEAERHIDYTPDFTTVTYCKPMGQQIDAHTTALQMVVAAIDDVIVRRVVWVVDSSGASRGRGPKWKKLTFMFKGMPHGYPKSKDALRHCYEEALLSILYLQLSKNYHKLVGIQGPQNHA